MRLVNDIVKERCERNMKTIYLIGFMGSGKSTIGRELAKQTAKTYMDTDQFIEKTSNQQIADIFQKSGESTFRRMEMNALKNMSSYDIISTGGGIVEREENIHTMKQNGIVIYLHASLSEIYTRLGNDENRPLWNTDIESKKKLYERRNQLYERFADKIIHTNNKSVQEVVDESMYIISNVIKDKNR